VREDHRLVAKLLPALGELLDRLRRGESSDVEPLDRHAVVDPARADPEVEQQEIDQQAQDETDRHHGLRSA
jgi:hypothetical protein